MSTRIHPLLSLQKNEISQSSALVREAHKGRRLWFRVIALLEPPREAVVQYLESERHGQRPAPIARRTHVIYQFAETEGVFEDIIDLSTSRIIEHKKLPYGLHPPATQDDANEVQEAVMKDPLVKAEIERLKLPSGSQVVPEAWPYGKDNKNPESKKWQVWMFLNSLDSRNRAHPSANYFAHPLDFSVVVDDVTKKMLKIIRLPMTTDIQSLSNDHDTFEVNPDAEYASELQPKLRRDLKPLVISQPEGVSFEVKDEQLVRWQKWQFHVDFNWREGVVLRDVRYDGRPVFYRLSLAEMTVPYGDPRPPFHRKSAYDLGEGGAGAMANNLKLGCDCLGVIRYFNRWTNDRDGNPEIKENCICMHEVDAGLGWKHTNGRNGRAEVTRARELVIQTIMTISNYEYALYWIFDTAAAIHYEVRATGIMSLVPMRHNVDPSTINYGIMVSPGVMAPSHQHLFCLRLDPAIDGYNDSSIEYTETVPVESHAELNPYGVAFEVQHHPVTTSGYVDLDATRNRNVKFLNRKVLNPATKMPTGYAIHIPETQMQLAHNTSSHYHRAQFSDHHFYFTKESHKELYPAGEFPWQSVGGVGVRQWAGRQEPLENKGVAWCTFGFTHNPRPEDWPVMPCEVFRVGLKPVHFFTKNPALDMPASTQEFNKSTLVTDSCCPPQHHERRTTHL